MKTLQQEWTEYATTVLPIDYPHMHLEETHRAYYAGVWTFIQILGELVEDKGSNQQKTQTLEKIKNECAEFMRQAGSSSLQ